MYDLREKSKENLHGPTATHEDENRSVWNPIFMPDKLHRAAPKPSASIVLASDNLIYRRGGDCGRHEHIDNSLLADAASVSTQ